MRNSLIVLCAFDGIHMARIFFIAAAAVLALTAIVPANASDLAGTWLIEDRTAKVRIFMCGEAICGNVAWLSQPLDDVTGKPQTDKLNVDPDRRNRPMLGVAVFLGMQKNSEDNKWLGRIYNPDDGSTYMGSIELINATLLKVKACVSIYCKTEIWNRSN